MTELLTDEEVIKQYHECGTCYELFNEGFCCSDIENKESEFFVMLNVMQKLFQIYSMHEDIFYKFVNNHRKKIKGEI